MGISVALRQRAEDTMPKTDAGDAGDRDSSGIWQVQPGDD